MKTRFIIDVASGAITQTIAGAAVPTARIGLLTARDVIDAEVVFMAGTEEVTAAVLEGMELKLGLRRVTSDGAILAQSAPHTLSPEGVASCVLDLNTAEVVALVDSITKPDQLFAKVYFEAEISKADGTYRQTVAQQQFTIQFEVNMQGDEPPPAAEVSQQTAAASAAAAIAAANTATEAAGDAAAAKDAAEAAALQAANAIAETFEAGVAGNAVPAAATAKGYYYRITADGTTAGITTDGVTDIAWLEGDYAIYIGTPGRYLRQSGPSTVDPIPLGEKGAPNGVATLGADGLLTPSQRPPITFPAAYADASFWMGA